MRIILLGIFPVLLHTLTLKVKGSRILLIIQLNKNNVVAPTHATHTHTHTHKECINRPNIFIWNGIEQLKKNWKNIVSINNMYTLVSRCDLTSSAVFSAKKTWQQV